MSSPRSAQLDGPPQLDARIGLRSAVALNMIDMIGVGPFITLPLAVAVMPGAHVILAWLLGALIALCDGLVWAELGATMPEAGGSYAFLRQIYGPGKAGRLLSFLFIWQLSFSAPLSIASGCIGLSQYAAVLWPKLLSPVAGHQWLHYSSFVAAGSCLLAVVLLYRNLAAIARMAWLLLAGVMLTMGCILAAGATHFHPALAFAIPAGTFHPTSEFLQSLGAASLIATYDYWGYYNICFLGGEVRNPSRTIPRAILISIVVVAALYIAMNVSILGVLGAPSVAMSASKSGLAVVSTMLGSTWGAAAAKVVAALVVWSAFASVFSLLLGYSRVPYAAALDGNYFSIFKRLHPRHQFPYIALLALAGVALIFCFFPLKQVIAALVVVRIVLQFLLQQAGIILLRLREPDRPRPFRVWLYPLPPLFALAGFIFILFSRKAAAHELWIALGIALSGILIFLMRAANARQWPFGTASEPGAYSNP